MTTTTRLSIVAVCYNMAREIPRTIQSFSAAYQRDVSPDDYEVILIDNGSTTPFDEQRCKRLLPGLTVHYMRDASPSPVSAINYGLSIARGAVVGVFIDGARMATPRLFSRALQAARLHPRPVIGSLSFHLGPKPQHQSVREGYNQKVEDALLLTSRWTQDGYNLFNSCAPDLSSRLGWAEMPNETNSLFLTAAHWREIGGYDENFRAPGGGLANLDIWRRLCDDETAEIIMLLGEGTFHQLHGSATSEATLPRFLAEYESLRGQPYEGPRRRPLLFGSVPAQALPTMLRLAARASNETLSRASMRG